MHTCLEVHPRTHCVSCEGACPTVPSPTRGRECCGTALPNARQHPRIRSQMCACPSACAGTNGERANELHRMCLRGALRREARMHDSALAREHGGLDDLVVPFDGERLFLLVDQGLEKIVEVLGVEARGRGGKTARHVEVAHDLDAIDVR